jgi:PPP family 3-phenylpropionic acid transporter
MPNRYPATPQWRLSVWYFWYFAHVGAFTPYFTLYLESLDVPAAVIGLMMSGMLAMRVAAPLLWGSLADRRNEKVPVVRLSAMLSLLCFAVLFVAVQIWPIAIALAAFAFFWSASLPLVEALTLAHLVGAVERYGRVRLWGSVGFIAAVLLTGMWLDQAALRSLLWIDLGILVALAGSAWMLSDPVVARSATTAPLRWADMLRRDVLALLVASLLMAAAHGPFYVFFSIHLVAHGYGKAVVGMLWSLGVVAEIGVFIAMPHLLRQLSARTILVSSLALAVVRFALIGWAVDSAPMMLLAQLFHGATFGAAHAAAVALLNRSFPAAQQARAQALYGSFSVAFGGMLGNLAGGAAWQYLGPELTFTVGSAFAAMGLAVAWFGLPAARAAAVPVR